MNPPDTNPSLGHWPADSLLERSSGPRVLLRTRQGGLDTFGCVGTLLYLAQAA